MIKVMFMIMMMMMMVMKVVNDNSDDDDNDAIDDEDGIHSDHYENEKGNINLPCTYNSFLL